jgi:hypothetical protein
MNSTNEIILSERPNLSWSRNSIPQSKKNPDRKIQQGLVDITEAFNLTQIHNPPTREENLLDLVFVTNPTLVKSTTKRAKN